MITVGEARTLLISNSALVSCHRTENVSLLSKLVKIGCGEVKRVRQIADTCIPACVKNKAKTIILKGIAVLNVNSIVCREKPIH